MKTLLSFVLFSFCIFFITHEVSAADKKITEYKVGDVTVISVQDMPMTMDRDLIIGDKAEIAKLLPSGGCEASLNVFLVKSGKDIILFDTGLGAYSGGKAVDVLSKAGIKPESITKVVLTHFHIDHIGGIIAYGKKVFPNAEVYFPEKELAFWVNQKKNFENHDHDKDKENEAKRFMSLYGLIENVQTVYGDKIKTFKEGAEIIKGIKSAPAYGHTGGMTVYEVFSKGKSMLLGADVIHCLAIQLQDPSVNLTYDSDPAKAAETRKRILDEVADKMPLAGAHLPYPGVIEVQKNGDKYGYKVVNGQ